MTLDTVLTNILLKIQADTKEKFNRDMPIEEIHSNIDIEFYGLILGVSKGLDVQLPKLGKFLFTNRVNRRKEKTKVFKLLKDNQELNPDFNYEEAKQIFLKDWALATEQAKQDKKNIKELSAIELLEKETIKEPSFNLFKKLGNIKRVNNEL